MENIPRKIKTANVSYITWHIQHSKYVSNKEFLYITQHSGKVIFPGPSLPRIVLFNQAS